MVNLYSKPGLLTLYLTRDPVSAGKYLCDPGYFGIYKIDTKMKHLHCLLPNFCATHTSFNTHVITSEILVQRSQKDRTSRIVVMKFCLNLKFVVLLIRM